MELAIIKSKIYEIRGYRVMLDFDLGEIYGIETKRLKEAVRRNIERFEGEDFMFELTKQEWNILRSQIATSSWGGARYQPFAFTELGVAMLSSVLNSTTAIEVNRRIMRAFVFVRQYALTHKDLTEKLKQLEEKYDQKFLSFEQAIYYLLNKDKVETEHKQRKRIGF
jgi:hypothetical protein